MTIATHTDFAPEFAGLAANLAFQLCLVPEAETVKAINALRLGFCESYNEAFPGQEIEGFRLAKSILTAALVQRHELGEIRSPLLSRAIH